jgi:hypothetical protein
LQQLAVYPDEEICKQVVAVKREWYEGNANATVSTTCIIAPAKVLEEEIKPKLKRKEKI